MCKMVLVSDEKAEKRGEEEGGFSAQFSEMFILAYIHIIGTSDVLNL